MVVAMVSTIKFQTEPSQYRHWRIEYDGPIANLLMDVNEDGGLFSDYKLKLNSYDLGVDIELADIVQRMRFEHPEVKVVVIKSAKDRVFCAGANIKMLGKASHHHKVNFCKFTNETRNSIEAAEEESGQKYIAAVQGSCAGGGYEIALACNYIMLTDDSTSSVALPEVPLLAVLPGTGGLTRITDKRKIRRDHADVFCSTIEGIRGTRAVEWKLVDELVPNSQFDEIVQQRAQKFADASSKLDIDTGIKLNPIKRSIADDGSIIYSLLDIDIDREENKAILSIHGPNENAPNSLDEFLKLGDQNYLLRLARELDDAILHLRFNETEIGLLIFKTQGDSEQLLAHEQFIFENKEHWLANEIVQYWKRVFKRIDVTSRSMIALVEHGSCFVGLLAEILWAVDRSYMMDGEFEGDNRPIASIALTDANFGIFPMANNLSRLETRFLGEQERYGSATNIKNQQLIAEQADEYGLVTYILDDIDWEDEIRVFAEERSSFSPDAMTGMEANLRFSGPETMETKIFGRLSAWQNWIFTRPSATGENGSLQRYGTGLRGEYDKNRV